MAEGIQPIFILPEGYNRTSGKDAQRNNIAAAKAVANAVKSTLGPRGMDKMLVDNIGDITITNDGVTVLKNMEIENPAAKMIVEVAKTQEEEVGDGTTTAVIIAGELLKNAETLLDQSIHPTLIARGYRLAGNKAQEILDKIKMKLDLSNKDDLGRIVKTAIIGKSTGADSHIVSLIVEPFSSGNLFLMTIDVHGSFTCIISRFFLSTVSLSNGQSLRFFAPSSSISSSTGRCSLPGTITE